MIAAGRTYGLTNDPVYNQLPGALRERYARFKMSGGDQTELDNIMAEARARGVNIQGAGGAGGSAPGSPGAGGAVQGTSLGSYLQPLRQPYPPSPGTYEYPAAPGAGTAGASGAPGTPGASGGGTPAEQLMAQQQQAQDAARGANEARYAQGMAGYQQREAELGSAYGGILAGYGQREQAYSTSFQEANQLAQGQGQQERQDIQQRWLGERSQGMSDLVSRGLSGSTIAPTLGMGYRREETADIGRLNERLRGEQMNRSLAYAGNMAGLQGDRLGAAGTYAGNLASLRGDQLGFLERRTDQYPDQGAFLQALQGMGQAQGATTSTSGAPGGVYGPMDLGPGFMPVGGANSGGTFRSQGGIQGMSGTFPVPAYRSWNAPTGGGNPGFTNPVATGQVQAQRQQEIDRRAERKRQAQQFALASIGRTRGSTRGGLMW